MLLVVRPDAQMPSALQEKRVVQTICPSVETLFPEKATSVSTLEGLKHHPVRAHFIPWDTQDKKAIRRIVQALPRYTPYTTGHRRRSRLPAAEFAFLSACHTAEITQRTGRAICI